MGVPSVHFSALWLHYKVPNKDG